MSPASGLKAGDPWTLKLFVVNEGKKPIRITDLTATTVVNGERSGGAGAKAREIAPQARVQVGEMAGAWKDGTQTWSAEVLADRQGRQPQEHADLEVAQGGPSGPAAGQAKSRSRSIEKPGKRGEPKSSPPSRDNSAVRTKAPSLSR